MKFGFPSRRHFTERTQITDFTVSNFFPQLSICRSPIRLLHNKTAAVEFTPARNPKVRSKKSTYILWSLQGLLALLFLFAGGIKLITPPDVLMSMGPPNQVRLPGLFLQFIGVAEVFGGLGLILPGLLRTRTILTPLAAAGLVIIMIGATAITLASGEVGGAAVPFVVGILASLVAYTRWRVVSLPDRKLAN
jgi:uncharacterized membrane protein YphA (DoxX/SURF4 family)